MTIIAAPTRYFLGVCCSCDRPVRLTVPVAGMDQTTTPCPACTKSVAVERIQAIVTTEACRACCASATENRCYCWCAGEQHGRIWTNTDSAELAHSITAWRARAAADDDRTGRARARQAAFAAWANHPGRAPVVLFLRSQDRRPGNSHLDQLAALTAQYKILTEGQVASALRWLETQTRQAAQCAAALRAAPGGPSQGRTPTPPRHSDIPQLTLLKGSRS